MFTIRKVDIVKMAILFKTIHRLNATPVNMFAAFFLAERKYSPKTYMEL